MATLILVGGRDAALEAARAAGHQVILVTDRRPMRRYKDHLLGVVATDLDATVAQDITPWLNELEHLMARAAQSVAAVVATTERSVLPAALLRHHLGLPGNTPQCAYLCRNKLAMKERIRATGLPCTEFTRVTSRSTATTLIHDLGLPLVLKPADSSGGRGSVVARHQSDVETHLTPESIAESYVHGIEMSVESFVSEGKVRFSNLTEYLLPLWANVVPATLPRGPQRAVLALNEAVIHALGIRQGMTHMELFLTAGGPLFSEIATRPPGGYLMELLQRSYGFDPWQAVFDLELGRTGVFPKLARRYSGMWIVHPGAGMVKRVSGVRATRGIPGVVEAQCRVSPGDDLGARSGSGESAGHIIAEGMTRAEVVSSLERARRTLIVELEPSQSPRRLR